MTRHANLPRYKEAVMSALYGEAMGFIKDRNLKEHVHFFVTTKEVLETTKRRVALNNISSKRDISIEFNALTMSIEYSVIDKKLRRVEKSKKLEDLQYKTSAEETLELTNFHKVNFDNFLKELKADIVDVMNDDTAQAGTEQ